MIDLIIGLILGILITYFMVPSYDIVIFEPGVKFRDEKGVCYMYKKIEKKT